MTQTKFCSHPVSEGATLFDSKSLSLHLCLHFFLLTIFCCPFHPVALENPRESKPSQQHSLKCLGRKKTPQPGVSPRENHGYSVVNHHQHHSMAPLPQHLPPAQTACEGNVPFFFVRWKAKQLIQGLRRWGNAEFQQFISNFSSSASTSAYLCLAG